MALIMEFHSIYATESGTAAMAHRTANTRPNLKVLLQYYPEVDIGTFEVRYSALSRR